MNSSMWGDFQICISAPLKIENFELFVDYKNYLFLFFDM